MVRKVTKEYLADLGERVAWTGVEAGIAVLSVEIADWDYIWVPILASTLAVIKGQIARFIGSPDSASTVPGV